MASVDHDKLSPEQTKELEKHVEGCIGFRSEFEFSNGDTIDVAEIETWASVEMGIETCGTCGYVTQEGEYDFDEDTLECVCNDCGGDEDD